VGLERPEKRVRSCPLISEKSIIFYSVSGNHSWKEIALHDFIEKEMIMTAAEDLMSGEKSGFFVSRPQLSAPGTYARPWFRSLLGLHPKSVGR
jgi:hypothetical protein